PTVVAQQGEVDGPGVVFGIEDLTELVIRPEGVVGLQDVRAVVAVLAVAGRVIDVPAPADAVQLGRPDLPAVPGAATGSPDDLLLVVVHVAQVVEAPDRDRRVVDGRLDQQQRPFEGDDPRVLARDGTRLGEDAHRATHPRGWA